MEKNSGVNAANAPLSFKEKLGYGLTGFGHSVWMTFLSTYILFFYTDVAHISPAVAGVIISVATIWDAVNDPLIAVWADNRTFRNGDRMRPYLIYASIPLAICLVLVFTVFGTGKVTVVMAVITYLLFRVPSTFYGLPIVAMRQLATENNDERVSLNTISSGTGAVGIASVSTLIYALICLVAGTDADGNMLNPRLGFGFGAAFVGALVVVTSVYNYCTTKERVHPIRQQKIGFLPACRVILKNRSFLENLALNFFYGTIASLTTGYALYYCKYVVKKPSLFIPISAMYILGVLVTLPFVSKIYKRLGRKRMMTLASLLLAAGSLLFVFFAKRAFSAFVLCFCIGVGTELITVMLSVSKADITDIIERADGMRLDGMVGNVSTFFQKLATALLTALLGVVLELAHYDADAAAQPPSAVTAIVLIMGLGGLISAVAMGIISHVQVLDEELKRHGIER